MSSRTNTTITYFELSWAALSALGLHNVLVGLMIAGIIRGFPFVLLVPIVVSAACALANGLNCYVLYTDYPGFNKAIACAFGEFFWLIQEAGLPFYGYAILIPILRGGERKIFLTLFWALIFVIVAVRVAIIVVNVRFFLDVNSSTSRYSAIVNHLHIGYFVPIAMAECLSAVFLLRKFRARLRSFTSSLRKGGKLYGYLMRSTEIRVAMLALIGISRAVTFSFNKIGHEDGVASQLDLFLYMLGSFFPIIIFIDMLASRLVFADECSGRSNDLSGAAAAAVEEATPFGSSCRTLSLASKSPVETSRA